MSGSIPPLNFPSTCAKCGLSIARFKFKSNVCHCTKCEYCSNGKKEKHCACCRKPICTEHFSIEMYTILNKKKKSHVCRMCEKQLLILPEKEKKKFIDSFSIEQFNSSSPNSILGSLGSKFGNVGQTFRTNNNNNNIENIIDMEDSQNLLTDSKIIVLGDQKEILRVRVNDKTHVIKLKFNSTFPQSEKKIIEWKTLIDSFLLDNISNSNQVAREWIIENDKISNAPGVKLIDFNSKKLNFNESYQLMVDHPFFHTSLPCSENVMASFMRSNQLQYLDTRSKVSMTEVIGTIIQFYHAFSNTALGDNILTPMIARQEEELWRASLDILKDFDKISSSSDPGVIISNLPPKIFKLLDKPSFVLRIPLCWKQMQYPNDHSLEKVGDAMNNNTNSKKSSSVRVEPVEVSATLWISISMKNGEYKLKFLNTTSSLKELFPSCSQIHVPKKYQKENANEDLLSNLGGNVGLQEQVGKKFAGLSPGVAGTYNGIKYTGIQKEELRKILFGFTLMKISNVQDDPNPPPFLGFDMENIWNSLVPEEDEKSSKDKGVLSNVPLKGISQAVGGIGVSGVMDVVGRYKMQASKFVAIEETICDKALGGRSILDQAPLSGHCSHILQGIFGYLGEIEHVKRTVMDDSVFSLDINYSMTRVYEFAERFIFYSSDFRRLQILRGLYLLRTFSCANTEISFDLLNDSTQYIFSKAIKHPEIFGNKSKSQRRELEGLKNFLDKIIKKNKMIQNVNNSANSILKIVENLSFQKPSPVGLSLGKVSPLSSIENKAITKSITEDIWYPPLLPKELLDSWRDMKESEFIEIWATWMTNCTKLVSKGEYSNLRSMIWNIYDSIPEFDHPYWMWVNEQSNPNTENDFEGSWINRWASILFRLGQLMATIVMNRMAPFLEKKKIFRKWGMQPQEVLAIMKSVILLDRLYCLENCDAGIVTKERKPFNFEIFLHYIAVDHYFDVGSENSERLQKYINYIGERLDSFSASKPLSFCFLNTVQFDKSETITPKVDGGEEEILGKIVDIAEAYYGGKIPNVDQQGKQLISDELQRVSQLEKVRLLNVGKKIIAREESKIKILLGKKSKKGKEVDPSEAVGSKQQFSKAYSWLEKVYKQLLPSRKEKGAEWLKIHFAPDQLGLTPALDNLKYLLANSESLRVPQIQHKSQVSVSQSKSKKSRSTDTLKLSAALERDQISILLDSKKYSKKIALRVFLAKIANALEELQLQIQKFVRQLVHFAVTSRIYQLIGRQVVSLIPPDEIYSVAKELLTAIQSLFPDEFPEITEGQFSGSLVATLNPDEAERTSTTLHHLLGELTQFWVGEEATFNADLAILCILPAIQLPEEEETKIQKPSENILNQIFSLCDSYSLLQVTIEEYASYSSDFDKLGSRYIMKQAVLVSEPLHCFWPPTIYGLHQLITMCTFVIHPLGHSLPNSLGSYISHGAGAMKDAIKGVASAVMNKNKKFPSDRQFATTFAYRVVSKVKDCFERPEKLLTISSQLLSLPKSLDRFTAKAVGAQLTLWFPVIEIGFDQKNLALMLEEVITGPEPTSAYSAGIFLPKELKSQIIRPGLDNRNRFRGMTSGRILGETVPPVSELRGEIDLCQEMRFDHVAVEWMEYIGNNGSLKIYDAENGEWSQLFDYNRLRVIVRMARFSLDYAPMQIYQHWFRAPSFDGPSLMLSLLGDLSQDRIYFTLNDTRLQRTLELKLFRTSNLPLIFLTKPQFVKVLLVLFDRNIRTQLKIKNYTAELYLRSILDRIANELYPFVIMHPKLNVIIEKIKTDPRLNYVPRLELFYDTITDNLREANISRRNEIQADEQVTLHQYQIHHHHLQYLFKKYGNSLSLDHKATGKVLLSYCVVRSTLASKDYESVNWYQVQSLFEWVQGLFQRWRPIIMDPSSNNISLIVPMLIPIARLFAPDIEVSRYEWTCNYYPTFDVHFMDYNNIKHSLSIDPQSGYIYRDGEMRTFVKYEHALNPLYQRYFGVRPLPCSYRREGQIDLYSVEWSPGINIEKENYRIEAQNSQLDIYRLLKVPSSKGSKWFQYITKSPLPSHIYDNVSNEFKVPVSKAIVELDGLPGFLLHSDLWILRASKSYIYYSWRSGDFKSVIHHYSMCNLDKITKFENTKEVSIERANIYDIRRYPSNEPVVVSKMSESSESLAAFEHPMHIEWSTKKVYLPRYKLSFTLDKSSYRWYSDDYPGYVIDERNSVDPFGDGSRYWITLKHSSYQSGDNSSYLLLGSAHPLLCHPTLAMDKPENYRSGSRAVWMDNYPLKELTCSHFAITLGPGRSPLLQCSSMLGSCWLAWLYLAKKDYYHCSMILKNAVSDTQLYANQLRILHSMLRWKDNCFNACVIKLKIISLLASHDPQILSKANTDKNIKQRRKDKDSDLDLLGLTKEEFSDLYLTSVNKILHRANQSGNKKKKKSKNINSESLDASKLITNSQAGAVVQLSPLEWEFIQRMLVRWSEGNTLHSFAMIPNLIVKTRTKSLLKYPELELRLGNMLVQILGDSKLESNEDQFDDEAVSALGDFESAISNKDIALDICRRYSSTIVDKHLLFKIISGFASRPRRHWSTHFVSIYNHLFTIQASKLKQKEDRSREIELWKFLLSLEHQAGDRLDRLTRILLFKVCTLAQLEKPMPKLPENIISTVSKLSNKAGKSIFGMTEKNSKQLETLEQFIDNISDEVELPTSNDSENQNPLLDIMGNSNIQNFLQVPNNDDLVDNNNNDNNNNNNNNNIGNIPNFDINQIMKSFGADPNSMPNFDPSLLPLLGIGAAGILPILSSLGGEGDKVNQFAPLLKNFGVNVEDQELTEEQKLNQIQQNEATTLQKTLYQSVSMYQSETPICYRTDTIALDDLITLSNEYFTVNEIPNDPSLWDTRAEFLFGEEHYSQKHYVRAAQIMKTGFLEACEEKTRKFYLNMPEEKSEIELMTRLHLCRNKLESKEQEISEEILELIRRPGQVLASSVCADQSVPLLVLLNLWENDQMNDLNVCYGYKLDSAKISQLELLVEQLDIQICWKLHILNIIQKLESLNFVEHPLERQATVESIYNMLLETMCYQRPSETNEEIEQQLRRSRKILAISRCNGFLVRQQQVIYINILLQNPNQAMQAPLGMGKSSVIVPLLADAFTDKVHCAWIVCPLGDKHDTLQRAEIARTSLNHSVLVFHFHGDGTTHFKSKKTVKNEDYSSFFLTPEVDKGEKSPENIYQPHNLHSSDSLQQLYCDLLRATIQKGIVVTTRESILYFVDMYEQTWLRRARACETNNIETKDICDKLLDIYAKIFPFLRSHCRTILDECDNILRANIKVNIALSDQSKINRDTLQLAVKCVEYLLDPQQYIYFPNPKPSDSLFDNNHPIRIRLIEVLPLMYNCQAATIAPMKKALRRRLAELLAEDEFGFEKDSELYNGFLVYVLCSDDKKTSQNFYETQLKDKESRHEKARNIVRVRELLGGSFATLFRRHNYALGRMYTNDNPDDVGPYSATNTPIKNSHLSSEYDWCWALACNYAMSGITEQQFSRYIYQLHTQAMAAFDKALDDSDILNSIDNQFGDQVLIKERRELEESNEVVENECEEARLFEEKFGVSITKVTKEMISTMIKKVNDIGDYLSLAEKRVQKCLEFLRLPERKKLFSSIQKDIPELANPEFRVTRYNAHKFERLLLNSQLDFESENIMQDNYNYVDLNQIILEDPRLNAQREKILIEQFKNGVKSRLEFLVNFVNLAYYPYYIEGNAGTIVHLFKSSCGFSGTMEVPNSLPQSIYKASSKNEKILRNTAIDGVILKRFLSFALGNSDSQNDSTNFVDDASIVTVNRNQQLKGDYLKQFKNGNEALKSVAEVILACRDAQAIVDGGALLDVSPQFVIDTIYDHPILVKLIQDSSKEIIRTLRWKDHQGAWVTKELVANAPTVSQQNRVEPLKLSSTLTFYDQLHSRGTDAKLSPDALLVNTVGDETRLTDWSQAEGRARQSGKGQTSRSIIAPHTKDHHHGLGPLSIKMLRILLMRSADSEVSEVFYAHAEQLRGYLRDYFRSAIAQCGVSLTQDERLEIGKLAEDLFVFRCDADLANEKDFVRVSAPYEYSNATHCLLQVKQQEVDKCNQFKSTISSSPILSKSTQTIMQIYLNKTSVIIDNHIIPQDNSLPDGDIGIPRPGEQSFGIVMNTEIAQEQMVEMEVEMEMEIELETEMNTIKGSELDNLRLEFIRWPKEWWECPENFWRTLQHEDLVQPEIIDIDVDLYDLNYMLTPKVLSSDLVIPLNPYYPSMYEHLSISRNLGVRPPEINEYWEKYCFKTSGETQNDSIDEQQFHWLHDSYIDPYILYVVLQHPWDGYKSFAISHQEYANYVSPMLSKPKNPAIPMPVRIAVYRHEGWGWVLFDSTKDDDGNPLLIDRNNDVVDKILAEATLLSGIVEIGDVTEQLKFFKSLISMKTTVLFSSIEERIPIDSFSVAVRTRYENLLQLAKRINQFPLDTIILDTSDTLIEVKEAENFLKILHPGTPLSVLLSIVGSEIHKIISGEFVRQLAVKQPNSEWNKLFKDLFTPYIQIVKQARTQIKVIASKHRPGINKKLRYSPMWRLLNFIILRYDKKQNTFDKSNKVK